MIEMSRLSLLIFGELLVGLTLLSAILLSMNVLRKGKIRKAARHLVERIQTDKVARVERLKTKLADEYRYEGEKLEQAVHDLTQVEMRLYQNIINSYLKQDVVEFQQADVDVENLVIGYQGLELPAIAEETPSTELEVNTEEQAEIERLQAENERLAEELRVTMDTMGRMLNEYSSMFAGGVDNKIDKQQIKGLFEKDDADPGLTVAPAEPTSPVNPDASVPPEDMEDLAASSDQADEELPIAENSESALASVESESEETEEKLQTLELGSDPAVTGEPSPDQTIIEESLMDGLAEIEIEIPDADELVEEPAAEPGSLEEEWAQLLAEDAESAELPEENEQESEIKQQGSV